MDSRLVAIPLVILSLAACTSSGGGSGSALAPVTPPASGGGTAPAPGAPDGGGGSTIVFPSEGSFRGLSAVASGSPAGIVVGDIENTTGQFVAGDATTTLVFETGVEADKTYTFNDETGDFISADPGLVGDEEVVLLIAGEDLDFVRVGFVDRASEENESTAFSIAYGGVPTAEMPDTGSATYSGTFRGIGHINGVGGEAAGTLAMDANFGAATVTGTIDATRISSDEPGVGPADFSQMTFTGNIAGSNFTGGASFGDTGTGQVDGGFFGPGAAEVAGAIVAVDGTAEALAGGFGGTRQ